MRSALSVKTEYTRLICSQACLRYAARKVGHDPAFPHFRVSAARGGQIPVCIVAMQCNTAVRHMCLYSSAVLRIALRLHGGIGSAISEAVRRTCACRGVGAGSVSSLKLAALALDELIKLVDVLAREGV